MATMNDFYALSPLFNGDYSKRFFLSFFKDGDYETPLLAINAYPQHATETSRTVFKNESPMAILIALWKETNCYHRIAESGACRVVVSACTYKGHKKFEIKLQKRERPNSCIYENKPVEELNKVIQRYVASKQFKRLEDMINTFNDSLF